MILRTKMTATRSSTERFYLVTKTDTLSQSTFKTNGAKSMAMKISEVS